MNQKVLQENLINQRIKKGLTQKQLATELNYSDKVISKWERGESIPNVEVLSEIADFYETTIDNLIGRVPRTETTSAEVIKLETIKTENPSFMGLLFIVPFASFTGVALIIDLFIPLSFLLLSVALIFYSFILAKASFETQYKGNQIRVKNRAFKVTIHINDEIVLVDKSVLAINPVREVTYNDMIFKFEFKNAAFIYVNIYVID